MEKEYVTHNGRTYEKFLDDDGCICLKRYSEKAKMWLTLCFAKECKPNLQENILEILKSPHY